MAIVSTSRARGPLTDLALVASLGGAAWVMARRIHQDAFVVVHDARPRDLEVMWTDGDAIRLRSHSNRDDWRREGVWGLEGEATYGRVGSILEVHRSEVVRELETDAQPFVPGERVRMDNFAYPPDPTLALGLEYETASLDSSLGRFPAWYVAGDRDTWVVFVHGKGSSPAECLRMLGTIHAHGLPSLSITYRNDPRTPACPTGRHGYGDTEWSDLESAVAYAHAHGARRVILVGYSMGGAVVGHFLARSDLVELVTGVILDSPMLDFEQTLQYAATQRGIGSLLSRTARRLFRTRYGIDLAGLRCTEAFVRAGIPTLLFHGDADELVPIGVSERLATDAPQVVTFRPTAGAHHVGSWNLDPEGYADAVSRFLARLLG